MTAHIGRIQGHVSNQLVKRGEEPRPRCGVFQSDSVTAPVQGNWKWHYGKSRDIGMVLQEEHSAMAHYFYLHAERIADGYESDPIFLNKAEISLKFIGRGELRGEHDGSFEVQRLIDLLTSSGVTHLFKAWESSDSLNPLDLLVFSKASPDSNLYIPVHEVHILED